MSIELILVLHVGFLDEIIHISLLNFRFGQEIQNSTVFCSCSSSSSSHVRYSCRGTIILSLLFLSFVSSLITVISLLGARNSVGFVFAHHWRFGKVQTRRFRSVHLRFLGRLRVRVSYGSLSCESVLLICEVHPFGIVRGALLFRTSSCIFSQEPRSIKSWAFLISVLLGSL